MSAFVPSTPPTPPGVFAVATSTSPGSFIPETGSLMGFSGTYDEVGWTYDQVGDYFYDGYRPTLALAVEAPVSTLVTAPPLATGELVPL